MPDRSVHAVEKQPLTHEEGGIQAIVVFGP
jgi:hypothetical protein